MYDSSYEHTDNLMSTPDLVTNTGVGRRFQAIKEHLFSELNEEAVVLSLKNGKYYGLNGVGVSIWSIVQEPVTLLEIESAILSEYDVNEQTCHMEVTAFIDQMISEGLIVATND